MIYRTRANNGRSQLMAAPLSSQANMHFLWALEVALIFLTYCTRTNNGRSRLGAAPLSSQAKMHFLQAFYVTI